MTISNPALARILDGADPAVRIQDDLFRAISGTWIREEEIPADLPYSGAFIDLRLESEANVRTIIQDLAATAPAEGEARKIADLYNSWMNTDALEAKGTEPLAQDLELIDSAASHDELAIASGKLAATGVSALIDHFVESDTADPNRWALWVMQSGIGLPDEAYYREEQHAETLAKYEAYVPGMFALALGMDENNAQAAAQAALSFEKAIAAAHMNIVDSRDADKTNNPFEWAEFAASAPGLPWVEMLAVMGAPIEKLGKVLVAQPETLRKAAGLWAGTDLETLKNYLRWRVICARSSYLTKAIDDASFDFYGRVLRGTTEQRDRWKRGVSLVEGAIGEAVGKEYVKRHFPAAHKEKMVQLVQDLLEAYRRSIRGLDWMGEETKKRALAKVDSFVVKIGYPDSWRDYSALEIGDDLMENVRAVARFENAREFAKFGQPVDRSEWYMPPQMVNAYYNPLWNEIVFPAAILQFPFFDPERDASFNYGGIGAVIGHEIGHGFDDQGSKYDETGALNNWWTDADRAAFEARTAALVAQYDAYVPAELGPEGSHVIGALTLGENIGDLGGASIGLKAYEVALEREGLTLESAPEIDGYTATQRFFLSYARVWREKNRPEAVEAQIASDPHSPCEFRANGVVKNIDAFVEAFGVQEGDALYLAPEERVRIW